MTEAPFYAWATFAVILVVGLALDLFSHRGSHASGRRAAVGWTIFWVAIGLAFTFFVWFVLGGTAAQEYLAAFLIEKSLSLDNLFVFLIIFETLQIPKENQRTALSWGVFGALVFRALAVWVGIAALERWEWVEYIFAGLLLYAAWRAFRDNPAEERESKAVQRLARFLPVSRDTRAKSFILRDGRIWKATPLLVAVVALELTDIVFAVDSIPAAFSVTRIPFLVYSSNAFAILGLRSLYIVLAHTIVGLKYLHYGLAAVLAFAAAKMFFSHWIAIPPMVSVGIITALIAASVIASLRTRKPASTPENTGAPR
jgi:tellurite resistance protein TerC